MTFAERVPIKIIAPRSRRASSSAEPSSRGRRRVLLLATFRHASHSVCDGERRFTPHDGELLMTLEIDT